MPRGIGEFDPIQEVIPEWLAVVIALLTQLGDGWFIISLLALLYWTQAGKQEEILVVGGVLACGIGLYQAIKFHLRWPRPDEPLLDPALLPWLVRQFYEATAISTSYGFPSGHATMSTIVYFGLAAVLDVGTRRQRYAAAAAIVAVIGFSRVALGLHFLVDIVVGATLGALLLVVAFSALERIRFHRVSLLFALAVVLNALYVVTSDAHLEAVVMLGVALGIFGSWQLVSLAGTVVTFERPSRAFRPATLRLGLAVLALSPLVLALEVFPVFSGEPYPIGGVVGLAVAAVVLVPVVRYSARGRRVLAALGFWSRAVRSILVDLLTRGRNGNE